MIASTMEPPVSVGTQVAPATVEFDVQLQPMDVFRTDRAIMWRQLRIFLIVCAVGGMLGASRTEIPVLAFAMMLGIFSLAMGVLLLFSYFGAKSTIRTSRVLSGASHYCVTPQGVSTKTETSWSRQAWCNFHEVFETRKLLILRLSTAQRFIVPKRCLAPGDLQRVKSLMRPGSNEPCDPSFLSRPARENAGFLTASVKLQAEDIYWGFITMLLRKSFWYAAQLVFAFALIFMLHPGLLSPLAFAIVGAVFALYYAVFLYWLSAKAIRTNRAYRDNIEYSFGSSGLDACGPAFSLHQDWNNYHSIIETSRAFLLCTSNSQMTVVPKRSFLDPSSLDAFRQLLQNHYNGKLSLRR